MYPVPVVKVAVILGGTRTLGVVPTTLSELAQAVAEGLPRAVVAEIATAAAPNRGAMRQRIAALVISPATYKRSLRLSPSSSERAERLARITTLAFQAFDGTETAQTWLNASHPLLNGRTPIETSASDLGARQVERLLHNIEHGLPI